MRFGMWNVRSLSGAGVFYSSSQEISRRRIFGPKRDKVTGE